MKQERITRQRLDFLLENWGCYQRSITLPGPQIARQCGSAEAEYSKNLERYVWEGDARVYPDEVKDLAAAERMDIVLAALPREQQRVVIVRYVHGLSLMLIAAQMRLSRSAVDALLDAARAAVMRGWVEK